METGTIGSLVPKPCFVLGKYKSMNELISQGGFFFKKKIDIISPPLFQPSGFAKHITFVACPGGVLVHSLPELGMAFRR